eukprot:TRINITY_DN56005_c0_g1_i1.p1 TRINITY_DN56005_c0_g1~~TRINITY_DN56005_c0_g1_i1.p1  ORF type:complete len:600 (-),score=187.08 TRINITY_DN56005_c0_g1_i1:356-2077(-)
MGDVDEAIIKSTQDTLGKLISKPKMTDKYLKKPPFRFLHDIVLETVRTTGFAQGLYNAQESDAANLGDKQAKLDFLVKAISCVSFAVGEKIDVSANKIVAGLDAEKTNFWLQKLHQAATTCVGEKSDEAVQRVLNGDTVAAPRKKEKKEKKEEDPAPPPPAAAAPTDEGAAAAAPADDEEAKKEEEKKRRAERRKRKEAEAEAAKAAEEAAGAAAAEAEAAEAQKKADEERKKKEDDKRRREERKRQQAEEEERKQQEAAEAARAQAEAALAQQDATAAAAPPHMHGGAAHEEPHMAEQQMPMPSPPGSAGIHGGDQPMGSPEGDPNQEDIGRSQGMMVRATLERPRTAGRRPPKVAMKVTQSKEAPAVAPVAVITEGAKDDDDDEDLFEAPSGNASAGPALQAGENHGKLVQDLLAQKKQEEEKERLRKEEELTREEVDDGQNKGIRMGRLKKKKTQSSTLNEVDIGKLGEMIQQLCQAANPLGKSIDLVHQDIANMGKELDKWKLQYNEASEQYNTELRRTEEVLQPLYRKVAELDDKISEQVIKIRNSRSRIAENDRTIAGLLEAVVAAK